MIVLRMIEKCEVFLMLSRNPDITAVSKEHRTGYRFAKYGSEGTEAGRNLIFGQKVNRVSRDTRLSINASRQGRCFGWVYRALGAELMDRIERKNLGEKARRAVNERIQIAIACT